MMLDTLRQSFIKWSLDNQESLQTRWEQYISEMRDSSEHIRYVANSDKCREEWELEIFENERTFAKPVQTIAQFKGEKGKYHDVWLTPIIDAIQCLEDIGGPDEVEEYVAVLRDVIAEANKRIELAIENNNKKDESR